MMHSKPQTNVVYLSTRKKEFVMPKTEINPNEMSWDEAREMGIDAADQDMVADDGEPEA